MEYRLKEARFLKKQTQTEGIKTKNRESRTQL